MSKTKKQSLLSGAAILSAAIVLVKIISVFFKLYVANRIGYDGMGLYATAYNIYTPIYSIALAGLPVAVSKMVASLVAQGKFRDVKKLFKVSNLIFTLAGLIGTALILAAAYPYAKIVSATDALPAIIAIAPSLFFCCVMSGYRGYYQGLRNMTPSAVSQIFEAAGKLIFGYIFINLVLGSSLEFMGRIPLLGGMLNDRLSAASSAGAILGVTVGSLMGVVYLILRAKVKSDGITRAQLENSPAAESGKKLARRLIVIAVPIAASSLIFNLTTFIDNITVQNRLAYVLKTDFPTLAAMYPGIVSAKGFTAASVSEFKNYLFGSYDMVLEIKNMVPTFTITLGLAGLPVLTEAWTEKRINDVRRAILSIMRISLLIALPAGFGMIALSDDLLWLLFGGSAANAPAIPYIAPIMAYYGISVIFLALDQPLVSVLQAVDREDVPIKAMGIGAAVKIIANFVFVSIPAVNIQGAVIGSALCNIVMVTYALIVLKKETGVKYRWGSLFVRPCLSAAVSAAAAFLTNAIFEKYLPASGLTQLHWRLSADNIACVAGVLAAVLFYAVALFAFGAITKDDISMLPKGRKIAKRLEKWGLIG